MKIEPRRVNFTVSMSSEQAESFAQFLKRAGLSTFSELAKDETEAYAMRDVAAKIAEGFAAKGYDPR